MENGTNGLNRNNLKALRAVSPRHQPHSLAEAYHHAELQAARLLELSDITYAPVPCEVVTSHSRISVHYQHDMPFSGYTYWSTEDKTWVMTINADEHPLRQRFSIFHEFKHIIDHPRCNAYRRLRSVDEHEDLAERVADYFAACVLMPKQWVEVAFHRTSESPQALSQLFEVSPTAMSVRLSYLGLIPPIARQSLKPYRGSYRRFGNYRKPPAASSKPGVAP